MQIDAWAVNRNALVQWKMHWMLEDELAKKEGGGWRSIYFLLNLFFLLNSTRSTTVVRTKLNCILPGIWHRNPAKRAKNPCTVVPTVFKKHPHYSVNK